MGGSSDSERASAKRRRANQRIAHLPPYWIERALGLKASDEVEPAKARPAAERGRLALALQGGGSFGAFTWGVLDRLLEEKDGAFDAISGASAGAVNATLLAAGLIEGGPAAARAKLERFWRRMSRAAAFSPSASLSAPGFGLIARSLAPSLFNPFNLNPLREALAEEVDFERLRRDSPVELMIGATRVKDGALRVFETSELTLEMVLASTCLPLLHHQIVIEGETYWDGGYAANPPLLRLALKSSAERILIVQITPNTVAAAPVTPAKSPDASNRSSSMRRSTGNSKRCAMAGCSASSPGSSISKSISSPRMTKSRT